MKLSTAIIAGTFSLFVLIGAFAWGLPQYKVYSAEQDGRATLARAEYAKQAQVQDAIAKLESAKYLAQAAGVIKSSLTTEYLDYLRIQMQEQVGERNHSAVYFFNGEASNKVVVPTK
jgi:regulator of protease activity HflC (stomatin/prohibitin superfamily)